LILLAGEIIFILVLLVILLLLIVEDARIRKTKIPVAAVREYWNGLERRQAVRIDTQLNVKYMLVKKKERSLEGLTKDISSSGMRLIANEKFEKGANLIIEFDIPNRRHKLKCEGKVVWSHGDYDDRDEDGRRIFQTGISFSEVSKYDRSKLNEYVNSLIKGKIEPNGCAAT